MLVYKWIEDCVFVGGHLRSILYDLSRNEYIFVDNEFVAFRNKIENKEVSTVEKTLTEVELEWLNKFIDLELIFTVPLSCFSNFPKLNLEWDSPSIITSAIVHQNNDFEIINKFLDSLYCKNLLIIIEDDNLLPALLSKHFERTDFKSLDLVITKSKKDYSFYSSLKDQYPVLSAIYIQDSNFKFDESISSNKHNISTLNNKKTGQPILTLNMELFMESIKNNVFFNKKIFIDQFGNISNSENTKAVINIKDIINSDSIFSDNSPIQDYWSNSKNDTDVCSSCEFRRMCIDDRIPQKRHSDDKWFFNEECNYNPFIARWSDHDQYKSLSEVGVSSTINGYEIDIKKLEEVNSIIWE